MTPRWSNSGRKCPACGTNCGKPALLDLFSGAGGAARGYQQAGFCVLGVDVKPQPHYAGCRFHQADALECPLDGFDAIHASPPCPGYSRLRHLPWLRGRGWPLLIPETRQRLVAAGVPWVIENVMDAPLDGVFLCGLMFGLPVYRHRRFESSEFMLAPAHPRHEVVIGHGRMVNDRRKGTLNSTSNIGAPANHSFVTVARGQFKKADGERALGIDWMTNPELAEAIPPAYTEWIGRLVLVAIAERACGGEG
jgi:DNA (cytosine-5)-methyltransferase 1